MRIPSYLGVAGIALGACVACIALGTCVACIALGACNVRPPCDQAALARASTQCLLLEAPIDEDGGCPHEHAATCPALTDARARCNKLLTKACP